MKEAGIDLMLHHFEEAAKSRLYWNYSFLMEQVANKARETRPQDSIKLYLQFGENLINQRGRSNYVQAAAYLLTDQVYIHSNRRAPQVAEDYFKKSARNIEICQHSKMN